ncbi:MAG: AAA family ATPase, partial [candidate division Zixibacteria bacterium]|nr:AAA family ATPase [candidate division Zixibacteria bacterium]
MEAQEKYKTADLIYDWNKANTFNFLKINRAIHLSDETFRDGLQSPSVKDPSIEQKLEMLHLTAKLGIQAADLGLPGSGERAREDITILAKEILDKKLAISPYCAVRTHHVDIEALIDRVAGPMSAAEILTKDFPEPVWAVNNLIPVGLTILAGKPKIGKSWMALQLSKEVSCGSTFLGERVKPGR